MALQKTIQFRNSSLSLSYWRIIRLELKVGEEIAIQLGGYASKDDRDLEKNSILDSKDAMVPSRVRYVLDDMWIHIPWSDISTESDNLLTWAYTQIKTMDEWTDATDI